MQPNKADSGFADNRRSTHSHPPRKLPAALLARKSTETLCKTPGVAKSTGSVEFNSQQLVTTLRLSSNCTSFVKPSLPYAEQEKLISDHCILVSYYFYKPKYRYFCCCNSMISEWVSSSIHPGLSPMVCSLQFLPHPLSCLPNCSPNHLHFVKQVRPPSSGNVPSPCPNQNRSRLDLGEGLDPLKLRDLFPGEGLAQKEIRASMEATVQS